MCHQTGERITYDDKNLSMFSEPLESYFSDEHPRPNFYARLTSCYRGYVGSWKIEENRLYLLELDGDIISECPSGEVKYRPIDLIDVLTASESPVFANWYSGELRIVDGKCTSYIHAGYLSSYETEIILNVEKGVVIDTQSINREHPYGIVSHCHRCGKSLYGSPKIEMGISIYCYFCAKTEYPKVNQFKLERFKKRFESAVAVNKQRHLDWETNFQYNRSLLRAKYLFSLLVIAGLLFLLNVPMPFCFLVLLIVGPWLYTCHANELRELRSSDPKLLFFTPRPTRETTKVELRVRDDDGSSFVRKKYRQEVLERDGHTCQWCGS